MNKDDFKRILVKFADNPENVIEEKGSFLVEFDGLEINIKLKKSDNGLLCIENDQPPIPIKTWIIQRLGKLDILANSILEKLPEDEYLIPTPCTLYSTTGEKEETSCAMEILSKKIESGSDFSTKVVYLTSEAGEGKTCIMNALARNQAKKYLKKESTWLFIPIALSGRPFLRLDEIIIGTLANFYRFRGYYFESFLELMKLDSIVLGLDGFEEMTIEGAEGDVVSSLGNLLNGLDSEGTMVFAARKAYYNYTNLKSQAKLFDTFRNRDVTFSELYLEKWKQNQFCLLLTKYGFSEEESKNLYTQLEGELSNAHPILTRAVLARKLVEEIYFQNGENIPFVISQFKNGNNDKVFSTFVQMLLKRETERWVTKGELVEPLLTVNQHEFLLELIAEEMWATNTQKLKQGTLFSITEMGCDYHKLTPRIISQCKERILHHAVLTMQADGQYSFCHDEFYLYFLGKHIAHSLIEEPSDLTIRKLLDKKVIPQLALHESSRIINDSGKKTDVANYILQFASYITKNSCLSQNLASTLMLLLHDNKEVVKVNGFYCSSDSMCCTTLHNIVFDDCIIEKVSLDENLTSGLTFVNCEISELTFLLNIRPSQISFDECSLPKVLVQLGDEDPIKYYDPKTIAHRLESLGVTIQIKDDLSETVDVEEDIHLLLFFKIVQAFQRSTGLNENVLRTKTGSRWRLFESEVLVPCLENEILKEIEYDGHGQQRRFRLNASFSILEDARETCSGKFSEFIKIINTRNGRR